MDACRSVGPDHSAPMRTTSPVVPSIRTRSPLRSHRVPILVFMMQGDLLAEAGEAARRHRDHPDATEGLRARMERRPARWVEDTGP